MSKLSSNPSQNNPPILFKNNMKGDFNCEKIPKQAKAEIEKLYLRKLLVR